MNNFKKNLGNEDSRKRLISSKIFEKHIPQKLPRTVFQGLTNS